MKSKPFLTLLAGVPCSGKSTYRNKFIPKDRFAINADDIQMEILTQAGWEYHERFVLPKGGEVEHPRYGINVDGEWSKVEEINIAIDEHFGLRVLDAINLIGDGESVVIDLTCHTKAYRASVIEWFTRYHERDSFTLEVVVFEFESIKQRIFELNEKRSEAGKIIPRERIEEMMAEFEMPTHEEGFEFIEYVRGIA